jgi:hypothetical protein
MVTSSPTNPYQSPRETSALPVTFSDRESAELMELRRRVVELERRVGHSWVVHPNFFMRVFAVFGYWVVGYAILAAIGGAVVLISRYVFKVLP